MPKIINIKIRDKIALAVDQTEYICGNSDFTVIFDFDEEWNEFATKTARFVYNGKFIDVVFQGNQCQIPIINDTCKIAVGVYAGNLRTTTQASIVARKSILCGCKAPTESELSAFGQVVEKFNECLKKLEEMGGGTGGGMPEVTEEDNGKILQVVNGVWGIVALADSAVKTYVDDYISAALGGDY